MVKADKNRHTQFPFHHSIYRNSKKLLQSLSTQSTRSGFPSSMMQGFNPRSIFHLGCIWCGSRLLKCDIAFGFVRGNRAHSYRQPTWKVHSSVHDKNCISDQHQEFMQKQTHHRIRWWRWLWAEELFWVTLPDWSTGKKQREVCVWTTANWYGLLMKHTHAEASPPSRVQSLKILLSPINVRSEDMLHCKSSCILHLTSFISEQTHHFCEGRGFLN